MIDDVEGRIPNAHLVVLSDDYCTLRKASFEYLRRDGRWQNCMRESYDLGDGVAVLPVDSSTGTVLLIKQFRWPTFELGNELLLIGAIAGMLDGDDPVTCIRRKAEEEAGVTFGCVQKVHTVFPSPGAVAERIHLFIGEYDSAKKRGAGRGLVQEGEDIEVMELPLESAYKMIESGEIIDAKTILLLQSARLRPYRT